MQSQTVEAAHAALTPEIGRRLRLARWAGRIGVAAAIAATIGSAILVKEMRPQLTQPMVALDAPRARPVVLVDEAQVEVPAEAHVHEQIEAPATQPLILATNVAPSLDTGPTLAPTPDETLARDPNIRWFNGRPVRPARTIRMTVTAYSPDARSCGDSADGITATLHPVTANGHALVAADPRVLRYGSMITVPGYDENRIVPVLDCGGAIKGRRLDVLYRTHAEARVWGVQKLDVIVWEYADGLPAENPRRVR